MMFLYLRRIAKTSQVGEFWISGGNVNGEDSENQDSFAFAKVRTYWEITSSIAQSSSVHKLWQLLNSLFFHHNFFTKKVFKRLASFHCRC